MGDCQERKLTDVIENLPELFVKVNSGWVWNLTLQTSVWKLNLQILIHKEKPTLLGRF